MKVSIGSHGFLAQFDGCCSTWIRSMNASRRSLLAAAHHAGKACQSAPHRSGLRALTSQPGGFAGRPGPRVPGLANLYLAGDWIGPRGFLSDASFASAREAARIVLQFQRSSQDRPDVQTKSAA